MSERYNLTVGDVFQKIQRFVADRKLIETHQGLTRRIGDEIEELKSAVVVADKKDTVLEAIDVWWFAMSLQKLTGGSPDGIAHESLKSLTEQHVSGDLTIGGAAEALIKHAQNLQEASEGDRAVINSRTDAMAGAIAEVAQACGYSLQDAFEAKWRRNELGKYPVAAVLALTNGEPATIEIMKKVGKMYDPSEDAKYLNIQPLIN